MKAFFGIVTIAAIAICSLLMILSLWGIYIISWENAFKIIFSAGIVSVAALLIWVTASIFKKDNNSNNTNN